MLAHQRVHTLHVISGDTHAGGATQMPLLVLVGIGVIAQFGDVFVSHQTDQLTVLVYHRQFLHLVGLQGVHDGPVVGRADGDQVLSRHYLAYRAVHIHFKPQVAVGHYTYQHMLLVHHRNTADVVVVHHLQGIADGLVAGDGHGIGNHTVLRTLHTTHLRCLLLDRHVLVDHTDSSFAGHGDSHRGFRDGIHGGTHHRDIEGYMTRELSLQVHFTREYFAVSGH